MKQSEGGRPEKEGVHTEQDTNEESSRAIKRFVESNCAAKRLAATS